VSARGGAGEEQTEAGASGSGAGEDALERLSTRELHDRALRRAEHHLDVRFFWRLVSEIPAAEALAGDEGEAQYDVHSLKGMLTDALRSGKGQLNEALRPIYLDYLREHPDA
jgi:hypothetical protein